jgi:hypothetical protein
MSVRNEKSKGPLMPCRRPPGGEQSNEAKRNRTENRNIGIWHAE